MNWHLLATDRIIDEMGSSLQGLSTAAVEQRLATYGPNVLEEKKARSALEVFLAQFKQFMILVLCIAAVVSAIAGDFIDAVIILVIVILNAVIGFIQEYRAEKAIIALKQLATPTTKVTRNGQFKHISSKLLVPGDIVVLEAGNVVPADMRIIDVHGLRIEESSLTGESASVIKTAEILELNDYTLGDLLNMAFKGTLVVNGRGAGIVVRTGMDTEIGKIARMLQADEPPTPLQKKMSELGRKISWIVITICALLFVFGIIRGEDPIDTLLIATSLAVAAIPEALPALITIALARGAKRLVNQNALVRKLSAVETLGSVSFICSDKTGTLTQNRMSICDVRPAVGAAIIKDGVTALELGMVLNHDVQKTADGKWVGDPTELALVDYMIATYSENLVEQLLMELPRVAEIPFDTERKCMTTVHKFGDSYIVFTKGAVESVCDRLIDKVDTKSILEEANVLASNGIRVLAVGYRLLPLHYDSINDPSVENNLIFAGLVGLIDPLRPDVKEAINECKTAGIRPVMITGDHVETASAIARELEILAADDLAIAGSQLDKLPYETLVNRVEDISVYARVSPDQKLTIVQALQQKKHFVAMTGDGVNDAPSLRMADIGVAMGVTGTDVSKAAADMILLDDNFATIVKAIKEGRRIYDNIRRFIKYIMTCNGAEILIIFCAPLVGLPVPLQPIHILWINLVTDGLPGLALASEKAEKNIMSRPPRPSSESIFAGGVGIHILWVGALMAIVTLFTEAIAIQLQSNRWQTMVFTVLSLAQLGHVFAIRSDYDFIYIKGFSSNKPLLATILVTLMLQMGVIYLPIANEIFETQPLSGRELLICLALSVSIFHAVELEKWIKKRIKRQTAETT
ncbi:MAG: ATPase [Flavipsychrobacter sp.]|jgi:Ca2+-transporting ATPase|nr:ATPase [Flavipsychrobacter sp.]